MSDIQLYTYKAFVTKVYDGDTITVNIDLGLGTWLHGVKLRLSRINAPEVKGPEREFGLLSRNKLRELILKKEVTIKTLKDKKGKFGRYIAEIYSNGVNISDCLVAGGFAEFKSY